MPAAADGTFSFEGLSEPPAVDLELSDSERNLIYTLAEPGGALWRLQKTLLDYARLLKDTLMRLDLSDPAHLQHALRVQGEFKAIIWQYDMWVRLLSFVPQAEEEQNV